MPVSRKEKALKRKLSNYEHLLKPCFIKLRRVETLFPTGAFPGISNKKFRPNIISDNFSRKRKHLDISTDSVGSNEVNEEKLRKPVDHSMESSITELPIDFIPKRSKNFAKRSPGALVLNSAFTGSQESTVLRKSSSKPPKKNFAKRSANSAILNFLLNNNNKNIKKEFETSEPLVESKSISLTSEIVPLPKKVVSKPNKVPSNVHLSSKPPSLDKNCKSPNKPSPAPNKVKSSSIRLPANSPLVQSLRNNFQARNKEIIYAKRQAAFDIIKGRFLSIFKRSETKQTDFNSIVNKCLETALSLFEPNEDKRHSFILSASGHIQGDILLEHSIKNSSQVRNLEDQLWELQQYFQIEIDQSGIRQQSNTENDLNPNPEHSTSNQHINKRKSPKTSTNKQSIVSKTEKLSPRKHSVNRRYIIEKNEPLMDIRQSSSVKLKDTNAYIEHNFKENSNQNIGNNLSDNIDEESFNNASFKSSSSNSNKSNLFESKEKFSEFDNDLEPDHHDDQFSQTVHNECSGVFSSSKVDDFLNEIDINEKMSVQDKIPTIKIKEEFNEESYSSMNNGYLGIVTKNFHTDVASSLMERLKSENFRKEPKVISSFPNFLKTLSYSAAVHATSVVMGVNEAKIFIRDNPVASESSDNKSDNAMPSDPETSETEDSSDEEVQRKTLLTQEISMEQLRKKRQGLLKVKFKGIPRTSTNPQRSFTDDEESFLMNLIKSKKFTVIHKKDKSRKTNIEKEAAWKKITSLFNAFSTKDEKSYKQIKNFYRNRIKKICVQKDSIEETVLKPQPELPSYVLNDLEKKSLFDLIGEHPIILNPSREFSIFKKKQEAWAEITNEFNKLYSNKTRTFSDLKRVLYSNPNKRKEIAKRHKVSSLKQALETSHDKAVRVAKETPVLLSKINKEPKIISDAEMEKLIKIIKNNEVIMSNCTNIKKLKIDAWILTANKFNSEIRTGTEIPIKSLKNIWRKYLSACKGTAEEKEIEKLRDIASDTVIEEILNVNAAQTKEDNVSVVTETCTAGKEPEIPAKEATKKNTSGQYYLSNAKKKFLMYLLQCEMYKPLLNVHIKDSHREEMWKQILSEFNSTFPSKYPPTISQLQDLSRHEGIEILKRVEQLLISLSWRHFWIEEKMADSESKTNKALMENIITSIKCSQQHKRKVQAITLKEDRSILWGLIFSSFSNDLFYYLPYCGAQSNHNDSNKDGKYVDLWVRYNAWRNLHLFFMRETKGKYQISIINLFETFEDMLLNTVSIKVTRSLFQINSFDQWDRLKHIKSIFADIFEVEKHMDNCKDGKTPVHSANISHPLYNMLVANCGSIASSRSFAAINMPATLTELIKQNTIESFYKDYLQLERLLLQGKKQQVTIGLTHNESLKEINQEREPAEKTSLWILKYNIERELLTENSMENPREQNQFFINFLKTRIIGNTKSNTLRDHLSKNFQCNVKKSLRLLLSARVPLSEPCGTPNSCFVETEKKSKRSDADKFFQAFQKKVDSNLDFAVKGLLHDLISNVPDVLVSDIRKTENKTVAKKNDTVRVLVDDIVNYISKFNSDRSRLTVAPVKCGLTTTVECHNLRLSKMVPNSKFKRFQEHLQICSDSKNLLEDILGNVSQLRKEDDIGNKTTLFQCHLQSDLIVNPVRELVKELNNGVVERELVKTRNISDIDVEHVVEELVEKTVKAENEGTTFNNFVKKLVKNMVEFTAQSKNAVTLTNNNTQQHSCKQNDLSANDVSFYDFEEYVTNNVRDSVKKLLDDLIMKTTSSHSIKSCTNHGKSQLSTVSKSLTVGIVNKIADTMMTEVSKENNCALKLKNTAVLSKRHENVENEITPVLEDVMIKVSKGKCETPKLLANHPVYQPVKLLINEMADFVDEYLATEQKQKAKITFNSTKNRKSNVDHYKKTVAKEKPIQYFSNGFSKRNKLLARNNNGVGFSCKTYEQKFVNFCNSLGDNGNADIYSSSAIPVAREILNKSSRKFPNCEMLKKVYTNSVQEITTGINTSCSFSSNTTKFKQHSNTSSAAQSNLTIQSMSCNRVPVFTEIPVDSNSSANNHILKTNSSITALPRERSNFVAAPSPQNTILNGSKNTTVQNSFSHVPVPQQNHQNFNAPKTNVIQQKIVTQTQLVGVQPVLKEPEHKMLSDPPKNMNTQIPIQVNRRYKRVQPKQLLIPHTQMPQQINLGGVQIPTQSNIPVPMSVYQQLNPSKSSHQKLVAVPVSNVQPNTANNKHVNKTPVISVRSPAMQTKAAPPKIYPLPIVYQNKNPSKAYSIKLPKPMYYLIQNSQVKNSEPIANVKPKIFKLTNKEDPKDSIAISTNKDTEEVKNLGKPVTRSVTTHKSWQAYPSSTQANGFTKTFRYLVRPTVVKDSQVQKSNVDKIPVPTFNVVNEVSVGTIAVKTSSVAPVQSLNINPQNSVNVKNNVNVKSINQTLKNNSNAPPKPFVLYPFAKKDSSHQIGSKFSVKIGIPVDETGRTKNGLKENDPSAKGKTVDLNKQNVKSICTQNKNEVIDLTSEHDSTEEVLVIDEVGSKPETISKENEEKLEEFHFERLYKSLHVKEYKGNRSGIINLATKWLKQAQCDELNLVKTKSELNEKLKENLVKKLNLLREIEGIKKKKVCEDIGDNIVVTL